MQSLGKIVLGAPPVGAKTWCLYVYRQDAARPRRGDSFDRFRSNLARPTGTWVRFAVQNFTTVDGRGGNAAQKYQKIQFLVKSRLTEAKRLTDFQKF